MTKDVKKKIENLRKEITRHIKLYYSKSNPEISDGQYDDLVRELKALEEKYPEYLSSDSPTQTVGAPVPEKFEKVKHVSPMLSLESVNDEAGAEHFDETCSKETDKKVDYMCEPKLDGISIELVYENGIFLRGSTRGDGIVGEDVTLNLKTIQNVPERLKTKNPPQRIAVRGEVVMHIDDFHKLNKSRVEQGEDAFANPRNVAAGSMRQLDWRVTKERKLHVYCYRILDYSDKMPDSQEEALRLLKELGLHVVPLASRRRDIKEAIAYHHNLENKRDDLNYETDGTVIKVNNIAVQQKLGTRTTNPKWAVAYKFKPRREITRVEDIVIQVGRTGVLTPLALLQSVEVGGVTVSRASLHNMDQIKRLDVHVGDYVKVERAGDVIPYIAEVVKKKRTSKEKKFYMPKKCPSCNAAIEQEDVFYRCPAGLACSAQLKEAISHYASKGAVDIDGFSDKSIESFHQNDLIKSISDVYILKREDILMLEGWKEKKTDNLLAAIEKAKDIPLERFVFALGIKNVGKHIAVLLAKKFGTLQKIIAADKESLIEINEIGPEIVESITSFFSAKKNIDEIEKLKTNGVIIRQKKSTIKGILTGKKVVFTGSLQSMARAEAKRIVESEGGEDTSSVTSATDLVVVGEKPGSKFEKAKAKGIKILTEDEFRKLIKR